jgi:hypothetical protein
LPLIPFGEFSHEYLGFSKRQFIWAGKDAVRFVENKVFWGNHRPLVLRSRSRQNLINFPVTQLLCPDVKILPKEEPRKHKKRKGTQ